MSKTSYTTNNNETKMIWDQKLLIEAKKDMFFNRFFGEASSLNSPIYVKDDLTKNQGDKVRITLRMRLNPKDYKTEGQTLENNEQKLTTYTEDITLALHRWGVRDNGIMTRQRAIYSVPDEHVSSLKICASEGMDQLIFDALYSSPTDYFYLESGSFKHTTTAATATSAITSTDLITPNTFIKMKPFLKTGNERSRVPILPIKIDGGEYYMVLVSPNVEAEWMMNSEVKQMLRDGMQRGPTNPIFTGAMGSYQGFVFYSSENVPSYSTGGSGGDVVYSHCKILGSGAIGLAFGKGSNGTTFEIREESFDYGNEKGYAALVIAGIEKIKFNSKDYGSVSLICSTTENYAGIA
jgi:N4-gp56 family major capsid protein